MTILDFHHPLVQSGLLPLVLGFAFAGLVRFALDPQGPRWASIGVGLGFLIATLLILGLPPWLPRSGLQKLAYGVAGGVLLGALLDWRAPARPLVIGALAAWPLLLFVWLAAVRLGQPGGGLLLPLAMLYGMALLVFWRLQRVNADVLMPSTMLFGASLGLAVVALLSASLVLGQLAGALAAVVGGFMLWNWPRRRDTFAYTGIIGGGGAWLALACLTLLLTKAPAAAILVLGLVFLADLASDRLPPGAGPLGFALRPFYLLLVALLPIAVAVLISYFAARDDDPYLTGILILT